MLKTAGYARVYYSLLPSAQYNVVNIFVKKHHVWKIALQTQIFYIIGSFRVFYRLVS